VLIFMCWKAVMSTESGENAISVFRLLFHATYLKVLTVSKHGSCACFSVMRVLPRTLDETW
jgi:hypothetical protein